MQSDKFSVLIPVYNAEKYLVNCIESIIKQRYNNIEIILVDDGSTDKSGGICDEYAEKYDCIKVFHQKNTGQFIARQRCLSYSTGDYCIFIDADDYWEPDLLEKVQNVINKHKCDVVMFDRKNVFGDTVVDVHLPFDNESVFTNENKEQLYKMLIEENTLNNLVLKAFKRTLSKDNVSDYGFEGVCYAEDAFKSACLIKEANKIVYLSDCLYNYRLGIGVTAHKSADLVEKVALANSLILKLLSNCAEGFENYKKNNMSSFMKRAVKYIIWGYRENPHILKHAMEKVSKTSYYQEAKIISKNELNLFEKIVLNNAEKQKFFVVRIIGEVLKIKNNFIKLR